MFNFPLAVYCRCGGANTGVCVSALDWDARDRAEDARIWFGGRGRLFRSRLKHVLLSMKSTRWKRQRVRGPSILPLLRLDALATGGAPIIDVPYFPFLGLLASNASDAPHAL